MLRPLTTAALLPALGAATVAWAQPAPQIAHQTNSQAARPAPGPWSGQAAPARSYAPHAGGAATAWRPPVIPHGGYPWREDGPQTSSQSAPPPEFRPVTSHPDARWRPYVEPVAPPPQPPGPWNHQPYVPDAARPAPQPSVTAPAPYPAPQHEAYPATPQERAPYPQPTISQPVVRQPPAPQAVAPAPARRELTPAQTPPPMPEPQRAMQPAPTTVQPATRHTRAGRCCSISAATTAVGSIAAARP